jgi:hypothetical protein
MTTTALPTANSSSDVSEESLDYLRSRRAHPARGPARPQGVPSRRAGTGAGPWRLTTRYPHECASCRRAVKPDFMEMILARKVWVFCGKPCALEWASTHRGELNPIGERSI